MPPTQLPSVSPIASQPLLQQDHPLSSAEENAESTAVDTAYDDPTVTVTIGKDVFRDIDATFKLVLKYPHKEWVQYCVTNRIFGEFNRTFSSPNATFGLYPQASFRPPKDAVIVKEESPGVHSVPDLATFLIQFGADITMRPIFWVEEKPIKNISSSGGKSDDVQDNDQVVHVNNFLQYMRQLNRQAYFAFSTYPNSSFWVFLVVGHRFTLFKYSRQTVSSPSTNDPSASTSTPDTMQRPVPRTPPRPSRALDTLPFSQGGLVIETYHDSQPMYTDTKPIRNFSPQMFDAFSKLTDTYKDLVDDLFIQPSIFDPPRTEPARDYTNPTTTSTKYLEEIMHEIITDSRARLSELALSEIDSPPDNRRADPTFPSRRVQPGESHRETRSMAARSKAQKKKTTTKSGEQRATSEPVGPATPGEGVQDAESGDPALAQAAPRAGPSRLRPEFDGRTSPSPQPSQDTKGGRGGKGRGRGRGRGKDPIGEQRKDSILGWGSRSGQSGSQPV